MSDLTPDELRGVLLEAAEAYDEAYDTGDADRLETADDALQQALSDIRRQRQVLLADGGESA
jgi:hypothetical protein